MRKREFYFTIEEAIAAARDMHLATRKHQAVVQFRDRLTVEPLHTPAAERPMWTTKEDERIATPKGRRSPYRRVEHDDKSMIRELFKAGISIAEIARKFEVSQSPIRKILQAAG